jgi:hypothetical protein
MYSVSKSSIKVNNEISDRFLLKIGVKQGDNLSPNLFKKCINDLPKYSQSSGDAVLLNDRLVNCLMYADDSNTVMTGV